MCQVILVLRDIMPEQVRQRLLLDQIVREMVKHIHGILFILIVHLMSMVGWMKVHLIKVVII